MSNFVKLSPQDKAVMEVLWEHGELTTTGVLNVLGEESWTRHTVRVYLLRLCEKALVGVKKLSRKKQYYYPLITKDDYLADETSDFLNKRYKGLAHMVAGLAVNQKVSNEDLDEIEQFIKEFRNKES